MASPNPIDPTPEEISAACRRIREEGYTDMQGEAHPPWTVEDYARRSGIVVNDEPRITPLRAVLGVQPSTQINADDWYYHIRDGSAYARHAIGKWTRGGKRHKRRTKEL